MPRNNSSGEKRGTDIFFRSSASPYAEHTFPNWRPSARPLSPVYDPAGRPIATIIPLGQRTTYSHDDAGRQIRVQDAEGNLTTSVYDPANQVVATLNAEGHRTTSGHDAAGRQVCLVDARASRTTFVYDAAGRIVVERDSLDRRATFGYDAVGNPVTKLDPRGLRITMLFDAANRLTSRCYADGRRNTFAYDAVGNRTLMLDSTGRTTTTYSPRSEVSCVAHPGDKRVSYSYDALSRRSTMTEPDGGRFTYSHDAAGRLTGLVNPQGQPTSFTFDALGREVIKELANGSITTQAYDAAGRLTGVTNCKSTGCSISQFAYCYDKAGNRTGVVEANGDRTTWSYDKTYQLTHEHRGGHYAFNATYTYDPVGNRLVQEDSGDLTTYTYDAANQILTEEGPTGRTTYTHDQAGNRAQKEAPAGTTYYAWDEDNRMAVAEPPAGAVTMTYTATGARVRKESVTETKRFLYDFNNLLAELNADDQTDNLYTTTVEEYGDLVSNDHGDHTDYYAYDGLGSTDTLTDDTEYELARHAYRAFGLEQSGGDPNNAFTFVGRQGYYRDDEIDLYLLGAASGGRHYDPVAGRFVTKDPIGYAGKERNLYRYAGNSPITHTDPSGERVWSTGDAKGQEGVLEGIGSNLTIRLANGKVVEVPRSGLSKEDSDWLYKVYLQMRTWTSPGIKGITARPFGVSGGVLSVNTSDNRFESVRVDALTPEDKKYLDDLGAIPSSGSGATNKGQPGGQTAPNAYRELHLTIGKRPSMGEFDEEGLREDETVDAIEDSGTEEQDNSNLSGIFRVKARLSYRPRVRELTSNERAAFGGVETHPETNFGVVVFFRARTQIMNTVHMRIGIPAGKTARWFKVPEYDAAAVDPEGRHDPDVFKGASTWSAVNPTGAYSSPWPAGIFSGIYKAEQGKPTWKKFAAAYLGRGAKTYIVEAYCTNQKGKIVKILGAVKIEFGPRPNPKHQWAVDWVVKISPARANVGLLPTKL